MSRAITGVWPGAAESPGNNPPLAPPSYVPTNRSVLAGPGLLGGGKLVNDISLEVDMDAILAGIPLATTSASGLMSAADKLRATHFLDVVADFGADPTGATDSINAFRTAILAYSIVGVYHKAHPIWVPEGTYTWSDTLRIETIARLRGAGRQNVTITVPGGKTGIIVESYNSSPDLSSNGGGTILEDFTVTPAGATPVWTATTALTVGTIRRQTVNPKNGLVFRVQSITTGITGGSEPTWPTTYGATVVDGGVTWVADWCAGIWLRGQAQVINVTVDGFIGNGFQVVANTGDTPPTNANHWYAHALNAVNNGSNGVFTQGDDANKGVLSHSLLSGNQGWGVHENSFLGNQYRSCLSQDNDSGSFYLQQPSAFSIMLDCYSESDEPAAKIIYPSMAIGGLFAGTGGNNGFTADSSGARIVAGSISGQFSTDNGVAGTGYVKTILSVYAPDPSQLLGFQAFDGNQVLRTGTELRFKYVQSGYTAGFYRWDLTNSDFIVSALIATEQQATFPRGSWVFPLGIALGSPELGYAGPLWRAAAAAPTTGLHNAGEVYWNSAGTGPIGWRCSVTGTPGTWVELAGASSDKSTGTIIMAVTTSGSDTPTVNRPATVPSGNVSAFPYAKPQAALDGLPKLRDFDVTINIGPGTFEGYVVQPWLGKGKLKINVATALSTLASGSNSGTAGTGTTSTSLVKPNAAANWTANDLRGKRVLLTGGGGFDAANPTKTYPIKSNTTTAASVDPITGMNDTTTFQIVDIATLFNAASTTVRGVTCCIGAADTVGDLQIEGAKFNDAAVTQSMAFYNNSRLTLSGIDFSAAVYSGAGIYDTNSLTFERNILSGANAFAEIIGGGRATLYRTFVNNSRVLVEDYKDARGWIEALNCTANSLQLRTVDLAKFALNASGATATPIYLDGIKHFIPIDAGLTGTNAGAPYGIEMYNGTYATLTGATITGAVDLHVEDQNLSYAVLALGSYEVRGTMAIWGPGAHRIGSEITGLSDFTVGGILKLFGFLLAADNGDPINSSFLANVTAFAGGGQTNAVQVGYIATVVTTVASAGDSIRLRASAKGEIQFVWNAGANACNLFPPLGGQINALGGNNPISIPAGGLAIIISTTGATYQVKVIA